MKDYERYQRQLILSNFGPEAQRKLDQAKVLVIGAGGLGCPILQYLVAAGVGHIGIIDFDTVSLSNLHRQVLYTTDDIGKLKVECAKRRLNQLNPLVQITTYPVTLSTHNAIDILEQYDIVIDGSDNFTTRYVVSDTTEALQIPLIYGAVSKFEGQVAVFNVTDQTNSKTTYRDLFPLQPQDNEVANCAEAGVLGVLPGMIGTLQATEAIKLITGVGQPLYNQLLCYQALYNQFYTVQISPDQNRPVMDRTQLAKQHYAQSCATPEWPKPISLDEIIQLREKALSFTVVDVREYGEFPFVEDQELIQLPLSQLNEPTEALDTLPSKILITTCATGKRSIRAAQLLHNDLIERAVYYYTGSILDLYEI